MAKPWKPLDERPADGTACWLLWRDRTAMRKGYHKGGRYVVGTPQMPTYDATEIITHWAPIAAIANMMPENQ